MDKDGSTSYIYDARDGFFFVPKYSEKKIACRKNAWAFAKHNAGKYVVKRSRLDKIEKFEWDINERNRTPHAKLMRKREDEVAAAAAVYLERLAREKGTSADRAARRRKRNRREGYDE